MPFRWYSNKYMCFFCSTEFTESSKLIQHTKEEHEEVKLKNVLKALYKKSHVNLDVTNLSCKLCTKSLNTIQEFFDHITSKHGSKIDKKESTFLISFKLSDGEMNCMDCGETFRFFGTLLRHAHHEIGTYICEICGRGFMGKSHVESHVKNVHSGSTYPCKDCSEIFATKSSLQTHNDKVHNTIKLKCPLCPEILGSKYLKTRHLALLHDVQAVKFVCDACGLIFLCKSKLISHVRNVHLKEKRFTCEICGFKVFNQYYLKRHLVKHSDERPFECEFCKKTFRRLKTLNFHVRIHTDDKRYKCKDCGKAFVQVSSLKSHIRTHHSQ